MEILIWQSLLILLENSHKYENSTVTEWSVNSKVKSV